MALACLELKNERKGSSSLYVWFIFEQKGKTVNARLQCLKVGCISFYFQKLYFQYVRKVPNKLFRQQYLKTLSVEFSN
jgi:hypothetical protein